VSREHYEVYCRTCGKYVTGCRCVGDNKERRYVEKCERCRRKEADADKPQPLRSGFARITQ
jgi:hypothetical protein